MLFVDFISFNQSYLLLYPKGNTEGAFKEVLEIIFSTLGEVFL